MFEKRCVWVTTFLAGVLLVVSPGFCEGLESDWNDFLHYTAIGRLDLASGYGQKIIDGNADPLELLELSEDNPNGYRILLRLNDSSAELREVSGLILDIIEEGRLMRRTDPKIITQEIRRLSTTIRGRIAAEQRLKNAGEYAIPFMLSALADPGRSDEFSNITGALPKIGRTAVRPLVAALQTENIAVKAEVIRALGEIGYPQSVGYLKFVVENDESEQMRGLAEQAIGKIDTAAAKLPAAEHLFSLGESYYYHAESVAPGAEYDFANIWFWDADEGGLVREEVAQDYFHELMAMRLSEWSLKADKDLGKAIALWIAAFFKAEATGIGQPQYFGAGHADAMTYATTAGPEYLHQALERALSEGNGYVALGVVEALAANAGEKSLLYRIGTDQPLVEALSFDDRKVRYSAAIAIGQAGPASEFVGSELIIENLSAAVSGEGADELGAELSDVYSIRAIEVLLKLAVGRNNTVDLSKSLETVIDATRSDRRQMQILAGNVLARLVSPDAQRAIADMAIREANDIEVRKQAFASLAVSAKMNAKLLTEEQVDAIYSLISSDGTDVQLRTAAASAYGALNLPSERVKDMILTQAAS
ncbi:MAG: HEAT repeat domain-containing protein [Planctomycetes bacterium]|nr:HEAT repeat domain-containing protein [Planctomycetota bacterium]